MEENEREKISDLAEFLEIKREVIGTRSVETGGYSCMPTYEDEDVYAYTWKHPWKKRREAVKELKKIRKQSQDPELQNTISSRLRVYKINKNDGGQGEGAMGGFITAASIAIIGGLGYLVVKDGCGF